MVLIKKHLLSQVNFFIFFKDTPKDNFVLTCAFCIENIVDGVIDVATVYPPAWKCFLKFFFLDYFFISKNKNCLNLYKN